MPCYEYRCRSCDTTFEVRRPMSEAAAHTPCPSGHDDTVKLLSTVSVTSARAAEVAPTGCGAPGAGGCCGGGACAR